MRLCRVPGRSGVPSERAAFRSGLLATAFSLVAGCEASKPAAGDASVDATLADRESADESDGQEADDEASSVAEANTPGDAGDAADAGDGSAPPRYDSDAAPPGSFCALPGSVVWTAQGPVTVPGGAASLADLTWLQLPAGFCAHFFGTVKTVRQLKFAPGGELFASSPSTATTGGANNGIGGIVVLPDDDHDGVADSNVTFLSGLASVQGLMFAGGYLYYQDNTIVRRLAYQTGDRQPTATAEVVTNLGNWPQAPEHWPRVFDMAEDGTIYISNGGSQNDRCLASSPVRGAVLRLEADGSTSEVAMGFRNPIAMRCAQNRNVCLVVELALDYSGETGGREKLVPLRAGDDWGYPCCATQNLAYSGVRYQDNDAAPDCSNVAAESDAFVIGHTPFGVDFETGQWPAPWTARAFVTLHGVVGTWVGARVVAISLDPSTGLPAAASELDAEAGAPDALLQFATGWDDGRQDHGRPAPVAFAPDGRMFIGDDQRGAVVWIAPVDLMATP